MTTLMIKDLETSKELTRKELSGVRGGDAAAGAGGQTLFMAGPALFSPIIGINVPTATAIDVHPVTIVDLHLANVIGSAFTAVSQ
jgi:hypothetical protein